MDITKETLDLAKSALAKSDEALTKAVSTSTGLVAFDLQAPAKNLYPVLTPLRNVIPRVGGGGGTATNWKQIRAITGSGWDAMGWVPEGQRSGRMSYQAEDKSCSYVTIGEEDSVTFEAESAGRGFEDVMATASMRVLQKQMIKEENAILGGNRSLALGTPATPTVSQSGSGATLPTATYSVIVVALSYEGNIGAAVTLAGVPTSKLITGADGETYTLNGGSSMKSAAASQAITLGQNLNCSVTPVDGAVAYAWYVGTAGNELIQRITYFNSTVFSAPLVTGTQNASAITADCSRNASLAFDGLLTAALTPANGAYVQTLATGTVGIGTKLTASSAGTINEIDVMLKSLWDNYKISPTVIYVASQQLKDITEKALQGSGGAPLLQLFSDPQTGFAGMTAGGVVGFYFNPYSLDGGSKIPIKLHPTLPTGTIIAWCQNLPAQYQSNNVPNVAEIKTRRDYYHLNYPIRTRKHEFGVYAEEALAIYAPFAMGVIRNIAAG